MAANTHSFIPVTKEEALKRGWENPDVILFSGDAYIDHPGFGTAIIARVIESQGFSVVIVPQPNWKDDLRDFRKFGKPNYFFAVTSGNMDSMINHYTANKRLRSNDAYTPGSKTGFRPDYAVKVYCNILKEIYPDTPVIIGGIEASLRRLVHYDYWSDSLKTSILIDSKADLLVYGMGEQAIIDIIKDLKAGKTIKELQSIPQTSYLTDQDSHLTNVTNWKDIELASFESCTSIRKQFAECFSIIEKESNKMFAARLIQPSGKKIIIVNPPYPDISESLLDSVYDLPYTRLPHPKYLKKGNIPAWEMIKFSINIHRGCFGGCTFCTISAHQGKFIHSRSEKSILNELEKVSLMQDFKGQISDLGGPSANMYKMKGKDMKVCNKCNQASCIFPKICKNLNYDHSHLLKLYKLATNYPGIKKINIGSGIRYDMLVGQPDKLSKEYHLDEYLINLITKHLSGWLKVAPEHSSDKVLNMMRKPSFKLFVILKDRFDQICSRSNLKQQLIPYLISSHPGSRLEDMVELATEMKKLGYKPELVQDFTPTPMTYASVIYYTGYDPDSMKPIFTAKTKEQRQAQKKMLFFYETENINWVKNTLKSMNKAEIIKQLY